MRRFKLHRDDAATEAPYPGCGVPVPTEAVACAVCGWDTRETHHRAEPTSSRSRADTADED